MNRIQHYLAAQAVTEGPGHHLLCYYDKQPWNAGGTRLLALNPSVTDRAPGPADDAALGWIDLRRGNRWTTLDRTHAWNFHTGSYLQWLGDAEEQAVIYPVRNATGYNSIVRDVLSGGTRALPRTPWAVSRDGQQALCIDLARNYCLCSTGGFFSPSSSRETLWETMPLCPDDDGIWSMDPQTGASRLIISLQQLARTNPADTMRGAHHYASYIKFNPDGSRFLFGHFWQHQPKGADMLFRVYTAGADGSGLHCVADEHVRISHPHWYDCRRIIAYVNQPDIGNTFSLFTDRTRRMEVLWGPDYISGDGHCSLSPAGRWLLSDTYQRELFLCDRQTGRRIDLGVFPPPPAGDETGRRKGAAIRCDLHPRWHPDGRRIAFNSMQTGSIQVYVMDVSELVA